MTVPPVPGSGLIVIETKLVFGGFEAILDGPAVAFYCNQLLRRRAFSDTKWRRRRVRCPRCCGGSAGLASRFRSTCCCSLRPRDRPIRDRPNHTAAALWCRRPPTVVASRMPGRLCATSASGADKDRRLAPGADLMVGRNAQDVALAGLAQHGFDVARSIHAIRCNQGERHLGCDRLRDHLPSQAAAWSQSTCPWELCAAFIRAGSSVHSFGK